MTDLIAHLPVQNLYMNRTLISQLIRFRTDHQLKRHQPRSTQPYGRSIVYALRVTVYTRLQRWVVGHCITFTVHATLHRTLRVYIFALRFYRLLFLPRWVPHYYAI